MRFTFDPRKSRRLRANPRRAIGFEEVRELFSRPYWLDQGPTFPNSIWPSDGWASGYTLSSLNSGKTKRAKSCILSLCGGRPRRKSNCMKRIRNSAKPLSAEAIARLADQGKDVSRFFKGKGRMVQPIQRVNVDVTV